MLNVPQEGQERALDVPIPIQRGEALDLGEPVGHLYCFWCLVDETPDLNGANGLVAIQSFQGDWFRFLGDEGK